MLLRDLYCNPVTQGGIIQPAINTLLQSTAKSESVVVLLITEELFFLKPTSS
jgi:hypothetical protein